MLNKNSSFSNFDISKGTDRLASEYLEGMKILVKYYDIGTPHEKILKEFGWPPFARTYTENMRHVINIYTSHKDNPEELRTLLNAYFIERLKNNNFAYLNYLQLVWNKVSEIRDRINILYDVLKAHKMNLYSLSVPNAIIQIEGILAEYCDHTGRINYKKNKETFEKLFSIKGNVRPDNSANDFVSNLFYEKFEWGDGKVHEISRHAILHGQDTKYATEVNSTRILHLLDYVIYLAYVIDKEI